jgi:hypothetical protein
MDVPTEQWDDGEATRSPHNECHTRSRFGYSQSGLPIFGQQAITHNPASPAATALGAAARKADDPPDRTPVGVVGAHAASLRHGDQGRRGNGSSTF